MTDKTAVTQRSGMRTRRRAAVEDIGLADKGDTKVSPESTSSKSNSTSPKTSAPKDLDPTEEQAPQAPLRSKRQSERRKRLKTQQDQEDQEREQQSQQQEETQDQDQPKDQELQKQQSKRKSDRSVPKSASLTSSKKRSESNSQQKVDTELIDDGSREEIEGGIPRPRGAAPTGKMWDYLRGEWVTKPNYDLVETVSELLKLIHADSNRKRPRGAPPSGKVWDYGTCTWVSEKTYVDNLLGKGNSYVDELREEARQAKIARSLRVGAPRGRKPGSGVSRIKKSATSTKGNSILRTKVTGDSVSASSGRARGKIGPRRRKGIDENTVRHKNHDNKHRKRSRSQDPWAPDLIHPDAEEASELFTSGSSLVDELRQIQETIAQEERIFLEGDQRISSGNVLLGWPGLGARFESWASISGLIPGNEVDGVDLPTSLDSDVDVDDIGDLEISDNLTNEQIASLFSTQNVPMDTVLKTSLASVEKGRKIA